MRKYDAVYILKANAKPNELRYSLRSIEENMTHGKVWFYCGKPKGIEPDEYVPHEQTGANKWERVRSSLMEVCKNNKLTKKFWLMNDDFFVLQPMTKEKPFQRGLLRDHYLNIEQRHGGFPTGYSRRLRECEMMLQHAGLTSLDYALHVPMLFDREKLMETLLMFPRCPMTRSLYGNYAGVGGDFLEDYKITDPDATVREDALFLSTGDAGFGGNVQAFLEKRFPEPCRYEVGEGNG